MVRGGAEIQPDNNWAKVHNSILELLASTNFSARELRCLLFLLRRTYGDYGKKENSISLNEWTDGTNLKRAHVIATLNGLVARNIVIKTQTGTRSTTVWAFNKYFENWLPSTPVGTSFGSTPVGTSRSTHEGTTPSTPVGTLGSTPSHECNSPYIDIERNNVRTLEKENAAQTASPSDYFGMPRPFKPAHVTADSYTKDAAKEGIDTPTFVAMFNLLIDAAGWRALVDAEDDNKLNFAKKDAVMLAKLGVKSVEELTTLINAYKAAYPQHSAPQPRQITEYASQLLQGVAPTARVNGHGRNGKVTNVDISNTSVDSYFAKKEALQ